MGASRHRRRTRVLVIGWTALLVACATAFAFKLWQNHALVARRHAVDAARRAEEEAQMRAARAKARATRVPVVVAYEAAQRDLATGRKQAPTTRDVADLFNGGVPISQSPVGQGSWHWRDPSTSHYWVLRFRDDVWVDYDPPVDSRLKSWTQPPPPPLYDHVERATNAILARGWLAGLWLGVATVLTLRIRRAAVLAHLLLATAVVCLLAGVMPLKHSPLAGLRSFMERLPGILLMIGVAFIALWLHSRPRPARPGEGPKCAACGYDLTGNVSGVCPECGAAIASP